MVNNKQQTAVEWLEQQIKLRGITHYFSIRELIEQAKEMEIEQKRIKLPSDEEISEESMDLFWGDGNSINHVLQYKAFKRGAKWMRDKIQGND